MPSAPGRSAKSLGQGPADAAAAAPLFQAACIPSWPAWHCTKGKGMSPSCRLTCTSGQLHVTADATIMPFCACCDLCCAGLMLTMNSCSAKQPRKDLQRQDCRVRSAKRARKECKESGTGGCRCCSCPPLVLLCAASWPAWHCTKDGACCLHAGLPAHLGSRPSLQLLEICHSAPAKTCVAWR